MLAVSTSEARHAETFKEAIFVQASAFVEAGIAVTLVDVVLTPWSCVSSLAVTAERAWCVDTFSTMFAGCPHPPTLVDVLVTCGTGIARGAGADRLARDLVCVATGAHIAGVPCTLVLQVAEETCLAWWAFALVAANLVVAGAAILTGTVGTLIRIEFAVHSFKSVDTDALVATLGVLAGAVVLARLGGGALVDILPAVFPCPVDRAVTGVGVHPVHTLAPMLAKVASAVVPVHLAVFALKSYRTVTLVSIGSNLIASSPILARARVAGNIKV